MKRIETGIGISNKEKRNDMNFCCSNHSLVVGVTGKRGTKQLITVFADAPEENKETAEPKAYEGDRRGLYFRAVGELAVRLRTLVVRGSDSRLGCHSLPLLLQVLSL